LPGQAGLMLRASINRVFTHIQVKGDSVMWNSNLLPRIAPLVVVTGMVVAGSTDAAVLVGWDTWADTVSSHVADVAEAGFTGSLTLASSSPSSRISTAFGSTDGSFGSVGGATSVGNDGALLVRGQFGELTLTLTLTNNSGQDYAIDGLHFDFASRSQDIGSNGPNGFTLAYTGGGLGPASTVIATNTNLSYAIVGTVNALSDYPDFDCSFAPALSDTTLATGESATFTLTFSLPALNPSFSVSSIVDNVAIVGGLVPEPASVVLLGAGGLLFAARRRECHCFSEPAVRPMR
jgi:hypothetical protein